MYLHSLKSRQAYFRNFIFPGQLSSFIRENKQSLILKTDFIVFAVSASLDFEQRFKKSYGFYLPHQKYSLSVFINHNSVTAPLTILLLHSQKCLHLIRYAVYNQTSGLLFIIIEKMFGQEIFVDSISDHKDDNRITYCDLLDQDKYVTQFLNAGDIHLGVYLQSSEEPIQIIEEEPEEIKEKVEDLLIANTKNSKKRSSFHNFQKHLVTTIRSLVDSSKFGKDVETIQCQKKIWKVFMNSNKINKTLVTIVTGDLNKEPLEKAVEYGFKDILREFRPAQIKLAQENILQELLKQLHQAKLEDELTSRRMKHKKQFVVYFQAFLEQLKNGELEKRMAKCTKLLKIENL